MAHNHVRSLRRHQRVSLCAEPMRCLWTPLRQQGSRNLHGLQRLQHRIQRQPCLYSRASVRNPGEDNLHRVNQGNRLLLTARAMVS